MPQIVLGRNYGGNVGMGASDLQSAAFLKAMERSNIVNDRADQAMNKAAAFMAKYNAPIGSTINNRSGVVNSNDVLQQYMTPQDEDLSRQAGGQLTKVVTESGAAKDQRAMNIMDSMTSKFFDKSDDDKVRDDILNGGIKYKNARGGDGGGGDVPGTSVSSGGSVNENFDESTTYNAGSITPGTDSYKLESNYNQAINDRFGKDSKSARMLAEFEEIGALASGRQYDPDKDVYLQGALTRDKEVADANFNDFNQNMAKRVYEEGEATKLVGPSTSNSYSQGYGNSVNTSRNTQLDPNAGLGDKDPLKNMAIIKYKRQPIIDADGNEKPQVDFDIETIPVQTGDQISWAYMKKDSNGKPVRKEVPTDITLDSVYEKARTIPEDANSLDHLKKNIYDEYKRRGLKLGNSDEYGPATVTTNSGKVIGYWSFVPGDPDNDIPHKYKPVILEGTEEEIQRAFGMIGERSDNFKAQ